MLEEFAGGLFRIIGKFFGYILLDLLFEIAIRGTGYFIVNLFSPSKSKINPDGFLVIFVGFSFWIIIAILSYILFKQ